jgi:hypothetical protein
LKRPRDRLSQIKSARVVVDARSGVQQRCDARSAVNDHCSVERSYRKQCDVEVDDLRQVAYQLIAIRPLIWHLKDEGRSAQLVSCKPAPRVRDGHARHQSTHRFKKIRPPLDLGKDDEIVVGERDLGAITSVATNSGLCEGTEASEQIPDRESKLVCVELRSPTIE